MTYFFLFRITRHQDYLGDSVAGLVLQDNEKCPPLPEVISSSACMATPCFHDKDCGTSEGRCCDNGCVFTCFSYPIGPTCTYNVTPYFIDLKVQIRCRFKFHILVSEVI